MNKIYHKIEIKNNITAYNHPAQKRITDREAAGITREKVLGGEDGWQPA